jgi:hypothetical protein
LSVQAFSEQVTTNKKKTPPLKGRVLNLNFDFWNLILSLNEKAVPVTMPPVAKTAFSLSAPNFARAAESRVSSSSEGPFYRYSSRPGPMFENAFRRKCGHR